MNWTEWLNWTELNLLIQNNNAPLTLLDSNLWTWIWVDSGSWWWTGRPGVLQFMGLQRVGHNWATELNWGDKYVLKWLWWWLCNPMMILKSLNCTCKLSNYCIKYMFIKQNLENIYRRNKLPIILLSTDKPLWTLLLFFLLTFFMCVYTHTWLG